KSADQNKHGKIPAHPEPSPGPQSGERDRTRSCTEGEYQKDQAAPCNSSSFWCRIPISLIRPFSSRCSSFVGSSCGWVITTARNCSLFGLSLNGPPDSSIRTFPGSSVDERAAVHFSMLVRPPNFEHIQPQPAVDGKRRRAE